MDEPTLRQPLSDAFQRAKVPTTLGALIVSAQSRGMKLPHKNRAQKPPSKRHKKDEGRKGQQPRKETTEMHTQTQNSDQNTQPQTSAPVNVPAPMADLDAIGQFGEQLGALLGGRPSDTIRWRAIGQDVLTFSAKAGVVVLCTAGLMFLAKSMSKEATIVDSDS